MQADAAGTPGAAQRKNLVDGIADGKGMPGAARRAHRPSVSID